MGTMIELPRAALVADQIAKEAEFFSFGTNDLTQTTFGISRDDINQFLPAYIRAGNLQAGSIRGAGPGGCGPAGEVRDHQGTRVTSDVEGWNLR